jgi:hypothetical protein
MDGMFQTQGCCWFDYLPYWHKANGSGESLTLTLIQIATNNTRGENWNNTTPRLLKMPGSI